MTRLEYLRYNRTKELQEKQEDYKRNSILNSLQIKFEDLKHNKIVGVKLPQFKKIQWAVIRRKKYKSKIDTNQNYYILGHNFIFHIYNDVLIPSNIEDLRHNKYSNLKFSGDINIKDLVTVDISKISNYDDNYYNTLQLATLKQKLRNLDSPHTLKWDDVQKIIRLKASMLWIKNNKNI